MQQVRNEPRFQTTMFPLDLLGEPNLSVAEFVELGFDLLFQLLDVRKVHEMFRLLRSLVGHIYLARAPNRKTGAALFYTYLKIFHTGNRAGSVLVPIE